MEKKPIVWRPNHVSVEDWNALSFDEQKAHWEKSDSKDEAKLRTVDVLAHYKNGVITRSEIFFLLCKCASKEQLREFEAICPPEIMQLIRKQLASYGGDESAEPRVMSSATCLPWMSAAEIRKVSERETEDFRNGIRVLRSHLAK